MLKVTKSTNTACGTHSGAVDITQVRQLWTQIAGGQISNDCVSVWGQSMNVDLDSACLWRAATYSRFYAVYHMCS